MFDLSPLNAAPSRESEPFLTMGVILSSFEQLIVPDSGSR
jgi:hypothetical protein